MTALSAVNLAVSVVKAGWRGTDATIATAVALGWSGGVTTRRDGLWGLPGTNNAATADEQAVAAHAVWAANGWGPFPSHRNKAYLLAMPAASVAVTGAPVKAIIDDPTIVDNAATNIQGAIAEAAKNLPGEDLLATLKSAVAPIYKAGAWLGNQHNWLRIAYVAFGGALVVGSLVMLAAPMGIGQVAGKVAGSIARPVTRALKGSKES